jgi:hypothetical protein
MVRDHGRCIHSTSTVYVAAHSYTTEERRRNVSQVPVNSSHVQTSGHTKPVCTSVTWRPGERL